MIHTLIIAATLYALFRAAVRGKNTDPMTGRLVSRDPALTLPMRDAMTLQLAACDDAVRLNNMFESPEQMRARQLRARDAAPTLCAAIAAWHAEQARLDAIDNT